LATTATIYGGVLAFNALLLAVGWSAFSKIYEVIGNKEFASFLRRHDILDIHIMFVDLVHVALALSAFLSFVGTVALALPLPMMAHRVLFSGMVGMSLYSMTEALRASSMMNDLIWDKAIAEANGQNSLRPVQSGVSAP
jgi:hypothetical protein